MAPNTLTKIGKYDVVEVLGKGGMGIVYKAMDNRIGRLVAIKMMTGGFAENPDLLKRFYREAQSTGMLQHSNIVIVYDLGDQDGNPYLVMEFLEGEPLDKLVATRRELSLVQKLDYIIQCCNGLNYAHQRGIVHRDIKPANLMILKEGSAVKIVDFGIARIGDASLTKTGQVVGTITYMSPEQINAQVVDGRTDIFSTGVMLYELLTYTLPFDGRDTAATLLKIIHEPPPPLKNFISGYPPELEEIVLKALAKDREDRYATAEDFAFDLSRVQEQLKKSMVSDYVSRAKASIEKEELSRAKELLQQVLKVDTQHSLAKELMHDVQQRLQKQVRSEQVRQLRSHAEDALSQRLFEDALSYIDQAITLDKTNPELLNLRDLAHEAKIRRDKTADELRRAESGQLSGHLEDALQHVETALKLDPESAQAKALYASISKEIQSRSKDQKIKGFVDEARKHISGRKFTDAFEMLKRAEQIDPSSPEVHALMNLASSGREQELRRRDLERITTEIEELLAKDDFAGASAKAEASLQTHANEPALLKLKALADKQRDAVDRRRFIDERMSAARKLLDAGKANEALALLEEASRKVPGEARLQSLLAIVKDSADRERNEQIKTQYVQKAKEAMRHKDYAVAVQILEAASRELDDSAEIYDLLQFAREEASQSDRRRKVDSVADEAHRLMNEEDYERAVALLEGILKEAPDEELRVVLTEARRGVHEFSRKLEAALNKAQGLIKDGRVNDAVAFLEAQPPAYTRSSDFCAVLERARGQQDQTMAVGSAIEKARQALAKGDVAAALNIAYACQKTYGETAEIKAAIAEIETRRGALAKSTVESAVSDARRLLLGRQYTQAVERLEPAAPFVIEVSESLQKQYESLKNDATAGASRQQKQTQLDHTIVAGSMDAAQPGGQTIVAGSYDSAPAQRGETRVQMPTPSAAASPAPARASAAPVAMPQPAPVAAPTRPRTSAPAAVAPAPPARKSPVTLLVIVAVVVLAIGAGVFLFKDRLFPPQATSYIEINVTPWGKVKSITSVDGKRSIELPADTVTPLRINVPPGDYKVTLAGPDGSEQSEMVKAADDTPGTCCNIVFQQIDVEKVLNAQ
ncbi:MAG: protein kinase [Candidatus Koribacter versatilis]|uniref:non-specific serine/threonine protein kinase n=1 Tax=Candidatus Korobacter versatilis TaxID=658062 RepID=A0A932A6F2_9BACT|nr:protein kinase [Candidatus Koribacter versatilis]